MSAKVRESACFGLGFMLTVLGASCMAPDEESDLDSTKSVSIDSWGRSCSGGTNTYHVCVGSDPANQIIFWAGPVPKGSHAPDPEVVTIWDPRAQINGNSGCQDFTVCSHESLRWQASFSSPNPNLPLSLWYECSLYKPISTWRQVWMNGQQLPDSATYYVQNPAPDGKGRNCGND